MEAKLVIMVTLIALLAGLVGGVLVISPASGGAMTRLGQMMSPKMMTQQMMTPQMMIEMCSQMMADPTLRTQMLEMHREMHNEMNRR